MSHARGTYAFDIDAPLAGAPQGTNILVAGPALHGGRDLALRLAVPNQGEGSVLVAADAGSRQMLEWYDRLGVDPTRSRMAFIDCAAGSPPAAAPDVPVQSASSPGDLTGIGMSYSSLAGAFSKVGVSHLRVGIFSLSTLLMYVDLQTVYRFGHTLSGRVQATDGLGVYFLDPSTQEPQTVSTLSQFVDGRVDVREGDDGLELRCRGRIEGPAEWTPYG